MERDRFVVAASDDKWWLIEPDADYRIVEGRKTLGEEFGWTDLEWFTDQQKLDDLYRVLENQHRELLVELDYLQDVDGWVQWLDRLLDALRPPAEAPAPTDASVAPVGHAEAAPATAGSPPPTSPASEAEPEAVWDDGWQMLYRVSSGGVYEFALSDDRRTPRPGTAWMSQEEAHAARSQPTTPGETPDSAAAPADVSGAIKDAISELAQISGETATQIASELGLSEEELAHVAEHPDLERMVAEELAHLVGQQSA